MISHASLYILSAPCMSNSSQRDRCYLPGQCHPSSKNSASLHSGRKFGRGALGLGMDSGRTSDFIKARLQPLVAPSCKKMSKKRPREIKAIDTQLIEIYEDLANEDEEVRLKAAYTLLSQFSANASLDQNKIILRRLFRGLCSGRKAARLGFSVALTELLSQVFLPYIDEQKIEASDIIDLLESQTAVDGSASGQVSPLRHSACVEALTALG